MKYSLLLAVFLGSIAVAHAQKKVQIEFKVSGVCGMCEERIEKALDVPGVIMAEWDQETNKASVAFKTKEITEEQIHQLVADAGHDTEKIKAKDEVYNNLHGCCKYRDGANCSGGSDGDHHDHSPE